MIFTNTLFIALPICGMLFGSTGVLYAVMYAFGNDLVIMTLGIWELKGGRFSDWRSLFINPLFISLIGGLIWALLELPFPNFIHAPFELIGSTTLPLALLVGGAKVASIERYEVKYWRQIAGLTVTRLIIAPLFVGFVFYLIDWHDIMAKVVIIEAAMPVGMTASIMAKAYDSDASFAASATLWSTIAAMITSPLIVFLFTSWLGS
jgi:predicted permease